MKTVKQRVLLVDDDPSILKIFGKHLELAGYDVISTINGEDALAEIRREPPDLIILDIMLPKLSGYEVCAELKKDDAYRQIPIVMFTAKGMPQEHVTGLMFGAEAYLSKTCSSGELISRVKTLLSRSP